MGGVVMKHNKNSRYTMVCVCKGKTGLPRNIWLESVGVIKQRKNNIFSKQLQGYNMFR